MPTPTQLSGAPTRAELEQMLIGNRESQAERKLAFEQLAVKEFSIHQTQSKQKELDRIADHIKVLQTSEQHIINELNHLPQ